MRIKPIEVVADYPLGPDGNPDPGIVELFDYLFPGVANPRIDANHAGTAITAHNPKLAMLMAGMSRFMVLDFEWSKRPDLRELAFATLHLKLKAAYPFESRLAPAKASGLTAEQLALIPLWENASVFDEEQRLVIEYANAVVACDVPDVLFARVVERYGEKGAVELTSLIGFWSCWAMLLSAIRP